MCFYLILHNDMKFWWNLLVFLACLRVASLPVTVELLVRWADVHQTRLMYYFLLNVAEHSFQYGKDNQSIKTLLYLSTRWAVWYGLWYGKLVCALNVFLKRNECGFVVSVGWLLFQDQYGVLLVLKVELCMSVSVSWCHWEVSLHRFVFLFSDSQESNNEYGCSYSVMRVVGNGSTVILNSISLAILSDDQLKCNGQPAVFCLRTGYTCISVTCRQKIRHTSCIWCV